jgi:hypothetical protein
MDQTMQSAIERLHLSFIWAVASRPRNPKMVGMPLPGCHAIENRPFKSHLQGSDLHRW